MNIFDCNNIDNWSLDETVKELTKVNEFIENILTTKGRIGNYKNQLINLVNNCLDVKMEKHDYTYIALSIVITNELKNTKTENTITSRNVNFEKYNYFMKLLYLEAKSIIEPQSCIIRKNSNAIVNNWIIPRLCHLQIFDEDIFDIPSICSAIIRQNIDLHLIEYINKRKCEDLIEISVKDYYKLREIYKIILDNNKYDCIEKIYAWACGYLHNGKLSYLWEVLLFNDALNKIYSEGFKDVSIDDLNHLIMEILKNTKKV